MSTSIVKIPVPTSGYGLAVDVSDLVGEKTVVLSGKFRGIYVLYGAHDNKHFVPILSFNVGGIEGIRQTFSGSLRQVKLRSLVTESVGVEASISGLKLLGNNSFTSFGVLNSGSQGPQRIIDLGTTNYQVDLNFIAQGSLYGTVLVEGSLDGKSFNPVGDFSADPSAGSLLGRQELEFSPLGTSDKVRYVRLNVRGEILDSFTVTIGGAQGTSATPILSETLHETYAVGVSSIDQTLNLTNSNGGKVVFDATAPGFSDLDGYAMEVLVPGGVGAAFLQDGGLVLGPSNILVGLQGHVPSVDLGIVNSVMIGSDSSCIGSSNTGSVGIGTGLTVASSYNIAIGTLVATVGYMDIVMGVESQSVDDGGTNVVIGHFCGAKGYGNVVIGSFATAVYGSSNLTGLSVAIGPSALASTNSVAVGWLAEAQEDSTVAIGPQTSVKGERGVVIGALSEVLGSGGIVVGNECTAEGHRDVVIGNYCLTDDSGYNVVIGFLTAAYGAVGAANGYHNIVVGEGSTAVGAFNIALGHAAECISVYKSATVDYCIAIGAQAKVVNSRGLAIGFASHADYDALALGVYANAGSEGMSFGTYAVAGAAEAVFSSSTAGGLNKFKAVSAYTGNPDLFNFEMTSIDSPNTTVFSLLIQNKNGSVSLKPVTLTAPIAGVSYLQVTNP